MHCLDFYTCQFITGHGKFNDYLNYLKLSETRTCSNCQSGVKETPNHLLFECQRFSQLRTSKLQVHEIFDESHLFKLIKNPNDLMVNDFKYICKYILTHKE